MIQAKVIADSKNEFGNRITTMIVTMPRIILAEFNTHRMLSRNSASSRAIPFEKMVNSIEENPFIPIAWQKDHKGMQGTKYITNVDAINIREQQWLKARNNAIEQAKLLSQNIELYTSYEPHLLHKTDANIEGGEGVTKQLCNRLLEPFMWHTVIVTATEWENFFALRCPKYQLILDGKIYRSRKDCIKGENLKGKNENNYLEWAYYNKGQAEIHMMALAEAMWDAVNESTPKELKAGEWHIPFANDLLYVEETYIESKIKIAVARCARVSYTVVGEEGKEPNYENDIKLHDRLAESGHWSPFEHCARAMSEEDMGETFKGYGYPQENLYGFSGNFKGFIQYRKMFNNENIE